ncbi:hypothetical protein BDZ89DRAFT_263545 [Hymenopellis radicata]|nr:hypothetical protein BDZ89DRAFT_263545 [Hymenopellis radicata]
MSLTRQCCRARGSWVHPRYAVVAVPVMWCSLSSSSTFINWCSRSSSSSLVRQCSWCPRPRFRCRQASTGHSVRVFRPRQSVFDQVP